MGSNLGPTIVAFAMNMVEEQYDEKSIFFCHYVDDVFAIFKTKYNSINFFFEF